MQSLETKPFLLDVHSITQNLVIMWCFDDRIFDEFVRVLVTPA